jgi:hypothetical protein
MVDSLSINFSMGKKGSTLTLNILLIVDVSPCLVCPMGPVWRQPDPLGWPHLLVLQRGTANIK